MKSAKNLHILHLRKWFIGSLDICKTCFSYKSMQHIFVIIPVNTLRSSRTMIKTYYTVIENIAKKFSFFLIVQFQFPCILLIENIVWSPEVFINEFGSTLLMKNRGGSEEISLSHVKHNQQQWLLAKCIRLPKDMQHLTIQVYYYDNIVLI